MKRIFDFLLSLVAIVGLSWLMALLAILIWLTMGRPILFRQTRPGLAGRPFQLVKFRTMRSEFDDAGQSLPDGQRITRIGKFLRSTSLDELPELWNILIGDMSFVGPRPLLMEYLPLYDRRQSTRHDVRPGLTGWAQINGRNAITWEEKFELDVWYVENRSFRLDLRILGKTALAVLRREGISSRDHATMEAFKGKSR